jgi:hypothetical protein
MLFSPSRTNLDDLQIRNLAFRESPAERIWDRIKGNGLDSGGRLRTSWEMGYSIVTQVEEHAILLVSDYRVTVAHWIGGLRYK